MGGKGKANQEKMVNIIIFDPLLVYIVWNYTDLAVKGTYNNRDSH